MHARLTRVMFLIVELLQAGVMHRWETKCVDKLD